MFGLHAATFLCRPSLLNPSMSSDLGARAQWRRHESAKDRRERRHRAECCLRLRLVRDAACVAAHRGGPREPDVVKRMSVLEVSLQELATSLSLLETSVVEKAVCCSDKVSSLESSLSELDNKVLGALAVSSGELSTKLAGFQELHQQLFADSQVGLRSDLQSCRVELERVAESVVVSESRSKAAVTVQLEKLEGKLRASRRAAIESLRAECMLVSDYAGRFDFVEERVEVMDNWLNQRFGA